MLELQRPWCVDYGDLAIDDEGFAVDVAARAVAEGWPVPHEQSVAEIATLVEDYVAATRRAREAGYKIVEIHGVIAKQHALVTRIDLFNDAADR